MFQVSLLFGILKSRLALFFSRSLVKDLISERGLMYDCGCVMVFRLTRLKYNYGYRFIYKCLTAGCQELLIVVIV